MVCRFLKTVLSITSVKLKHNIFAFFSNMMQNLLRGNNETTGLKRDFYIYLK